MLVAFLKYRTTLILLIFFTVAGCSGGSTTTSTTAATTSTTFPLSQAVSTSVSSGWSKTFSLSQTGSTTCSGSGSRVVSPASTSTTFNVTPTNTVSALSSVQTLTWSWTNCTPSTGASTSTSYYNPSNYLGLGFNNSVSYGSFLTAPSYPATVTINTSGTIGTETLYTDSTQAVNDGRSDFSYTVAADTADTALVTFIGKRYSSAGVLQSTDLELWRISTTGVLTPITSTVQYATGTNVVYTYN